MKAIKDITVYLNAPRADMKVPIGEATQPEQPEPPAQIESAQLMSLEELGDRILKDFAKGTDINSLAPLQLEGGARIEKVLLNCAGCELPSTILSGTRTQPTPWLAEYVGLCFCPECWFFTPFNSRLRQKAGEPEVLVLWCEYGQWQSAPAIEESWSFFRWLVIDAQRKWNWFRMRARRKEILGDEDDEETGDGESRKDV
jgi:hypothetical protein